MGHDREKAYTGAEMTFNLEQQKRLAEMKQVRALLADEVISLITTEQKAMCGLYSKHAYGINKVCNRLKLFVGELLENDNAKS
jgi:hypothetical protein